MYLFVREDLTPSQQIVQVAHATFEVGREHDVPSPHYVLIGVKNRDELLRVSDWLSEINIDHKMFYEPDFDTKDTAIATKPIYGDQRSQFKKFRLLNHQTTVA